jgi:hypothetical protein
MEEILRQILEENKKSSSAMRDMAQGIIDLTHGQEIMARDINRLVESQEKMAGDINKLTIGQGRLEKVTKGLAKDVGDIKMYLEKGLELDMDRIKDRLTVLEDNQKIS